ncbi:MAG: DDE-type integrase/transposase/recombinase [Pseudonocardiales bacterium]|nr:DDE-type integrase/transposase/recombinase [Pseudonocardiales bacterium]
MFWAVAWCVLNPLLIDAARSCRHTPGDQWFVDETYLKVSERWVYLYWAIDQFGQVIESSSCCDPAQTLSDRRPFTADGRPLSEVYRRASAC